MITTLTAAPGTVAVSDDELRRFAPSVFASQPIDGVSERYRFLPTSSILNGMRENGWVPVRAQEQSIRTEARRGFQKHVVRFARVEHLQTWEKNQVRPEVVLVNSHDKSSAYQLHCGLFRLVCTNGMVVSDGTFQRISIKHSGFNPDSVIEASFKSVRAEHIRMGVYFLPPSAGNVARSDSILAHCQARRRDGHARRIQSTKPVGG
jgi:hypothetical protein